MTHEEIEGRIGQIGRVLDALRGAWPALSMEIQSRVTQLTESLITQDNEQERGAIKELRNLLNLPETLQYEREGLAAALSEQSDAAH